MHILGWFDQITCGNGTDKGLQLDDSACFTYFKAMTENARTAQGILMLAYHSLGSSFPRASRTHDQAMHLLTCL
jgi:hypothetical protein